MEKVKLTDICRPKQWKTISGDEISKVGKYPVYGANGKMGFFHEYNHIDETLLIGCRGTCGTLHITEKFSYTNGNAMALDNLDKKANIKFLYYFFSKRGFNDVVSGGVQKQITIQNLQRIEIPLPSIAIQQKIAAILDQADAIIQNNRAIVQKYDDLTQSLFLDMFGDPVKNEKGFILKKLEDCYSSKKEGTKCGPFGGALKKEEFVDNGIPVWNMDNISKNGELVSDINLFITDDKYNILKSYSVINDDIIISRAGTVGKMCVVNSKHEKSIISTNLIRLRLNKNLLLPMYFVLLMTFFKERICRLQTGADGAFTHMNTGVLNEIIFPLPPINLQNQFAERVAVIEAQKQQAQLELAKSEELFASLLQRAFKGELS